MGTTLENAEAEARIIRTFTDPSIREGYIVALADEVLRLRAQLVGEDEAWEKSFAEWKTVFAQWKDAR